MAADVYLDANATSPVLPAAIAAAVEAMGLPSRRSGNRSAKAALCLSRAGHAQAWTVLGGAALVMRDE